MKTHNVPRWSPSIARLGLSAGLVLAAWLLATCGGGPIASGPAAQADVLVEYRRTGGLAGFDDHLTIQPDGAATLERKGQDPKTFSLDEEAVSTLRQVLNQADFSELEGQHEPGRAIPDALHYEVTYVRNTSRFTVKASDGAVPEELAPALDMLDHIIANH